MADYVEDTINIIELAIIGAIAYYIWKVYDGTKSNLANGGFDCANASVAAWLPFGMGASNYSDDYVIACGGGLTVGGMRAAQLTDKEIMDTIVNGACGCYAAQQQGKKVIDNVVVPSIGGDINL